MKFYFKTLILIYYSFFLSSLLIVLISLYLLGFELEFQTYFSNSKLLVIILFVLISSILSQYIYKKNISRVNKNDQLIIKLQTYQSASIYRLSILEFTLIITTLFFIFSKLWIIFLLVVILLFFIIISRPSKKAFLNIFSLTEEELKSIG
jgi:hypothetical protein